MSCSIQFTCDECGAAKGEANHWFAIEVTPGNDDGVICIFAFTNAGESDKHYCGETCALRAVAKALPALHVAVTPPSTEPA